MTPEYRRIRTHLSRRDSILKGAIKTVGPCTIVPRENYFETLVRAIVSQQISTKAAASIFAKLKTALGRRGVKPRALIETDDESLRGAGLSGNKLKSLRDLAEKCLSGEVPLKKLGEMEDEAIIEALLPVRGIGRWTAEMFLIFSLGRHDIFPIADYGVKAGIMKLYGLPELPKKETMLEVSEAWKPYRSIASWYLWRYLEHKPKA